MYFTQEWASTNVRYFLIFVLWKHSRKMKWNYTKEKKEIMKKFQNWHYYKKHCITFFWFTVSLLGQDRTESSTNADPLAQAGNLQTGILFDELVSGVLMTNKWQASGEFHIVFFFVSHLFALPLEFYSWPVVRIHAPHTCFYLCLVSQTCDW